MQASALATKIQIPPQTHRVVRRARLIDALEHGIPEHKLVLISAPAGYGKTTLLAQWAHTSSFRVAWLSLGEEDNDPDRFFRYLLAAWETVHPGIRESPLGLLLGALEPDRDAVLSAFINVANDLPDHTVFVLDDVHLIEDPAIHEALTFLLDHLPPTLHFVLAGRAEPPLPLARYRARHELLELRTEDLQFRVDETAAFLNQLMGLDLAADEIVPLHTQLEGWVAGLQLVSLTLRRQSEVSPLVVSGRHRFIADYLSEDVLAHLPDEIRRFLLQTSILDRLCGPLCDAVTEDIGWAGDAGAPGTRESLPRAAGRPAGSGFAITGSSPTSCARNCTAVTQMRSSSSIAGRPGGIWPMTCRKRPSTMRSPETTLNSGSASSTAMRTRSCRAASTRSCNAGSTRSRRRGTPPTPRSTSPGPASWPSPARSMPACAASMTSNRGWRTRTATTHAGSWQR